MDDRNDLCSCVIPYVGVSQGHVVSQVIPENCVVTDMQAEGLEGAIRQFVELLCSYGHVDSSETCEDDIIAREKLMSTELAENVHLPHARTGAARRMVSAIGVCRFAGDDDRHLVVLTVAPKEKECPYMQYLAHMASVLSLIRNRWNLLSEMSAAALRKLFLE